MIDLNSCNHRFTSVEDRGISSKYWIEKDGKSYLFKANFLYDSDPNVMKLNSKTNYGEVLMSRVMKRLGIPCVEAIFAKGSIGKDICDGVLIESYLTSNIVDNISFKTMISYARNTNDGYYQYNNVADCVEIVKGISGKLGKCIDIEKVKDQLTIMCIVDYFFGQADRNTTNIEFLITSDNQMKLAPMFDNGHCLSFTCETQGSRSYSKELKENKFNVGYLGNKGIFFLSNCGYNDIYSTHNTRNLVLDICEVASKNKRYSKLVNTLMNLDIAQEIVKIDKENDTKINSDYINSAEVIFNNRKRMFLNEWVKYKPTCSQETIFGK